MENFEIKKLTKEYIDDVFEIEKHFFGLTKNDTIVSSLTSETLSYFVLFNGDMVIGFLEGSIVVDEAEIFDIAILEQWQGKKLSEKLMDYFVDFCKEKNVCTIFLEVNKNNNKALNLYKKYGFAEYAIRKNYYGDSDAILMKCDL